MYNRTIFCYNYFIKRDTEQTAPPGKAEVIILWKANERFA